ncbi:MAG: extracellular solute-binding protein [Acetobacteraceae bacterium]
MRATTGALAAPYVIPALAADTLVVNGYGAEFQEFMMRTTIEPFEKKFGVKVTYDNTGMASQNYAKIRASRGAPGFDVAAELTPAEVILGQKEKLLEEITEAQVPNLKYVWAKSRTIIPPYGVVHGYQYLSLLWNKNRLERPESWANYWQPGAAYGDKIKGHLVAFEPANLLAVYALIMAAKLKGGGVENMQPAWDLLAAQKPWIGMSLLASDAAAPYFENDQVWLAPFWSARAGYYVGRNYPVAFTIPKEGTIGLANCACVPIGAANKKLAFEFINFRLEPDIQRAFHQAYRTSPGRPDLGDWPPEYAATQITTEAKLASVEFPDSAFIGSKRSEWTRKWQEVMSG